jgi:nucleoside-diphosphate-sugar epimerase
MEICGRKVSIVTEENRLRPEKSEVNRLLADNRLLRELTGWQSRVPFRNGLEKTADWIRNNLDHFDPTHYTR